MPRGVPDGSTRGTRFAPPSHLSEFEMLCSSTRPHGRAALDYGILCCIVALSSMVSAPLRANDTLGIRVPDGFEVTRFATDEQAHDINCMTIDSAAGSSHSLNYSGSTQYGSASAPDRIE